MFLRVQRTNYFILFGLVLTQAAPLPSKEPIPYITIDHALVWLRKYGYLACEVTNSLDLSRLKVFPTALPLQTTSRPLTFDQEQQTKNSCSIEHVENALRRVQILSGLPQTGLFDKATAERMAATRCGNSDSAIVAVSDLPITTGLRQTRQKRSATLIENMNFVLGSNVELDELVEEWPAEQRRRPFSNTSKIHKEQQRQKRSPVPSGRNRLSDAIGAVLMRILGNSAQSSSSAAPTTLTSPAPKKTDRTIYWHLNPTSLSRRVPLKVQRETVRLAFRMWSEVTPMRFVEAPSHLATDSTMKNPITISFATGFHNGCTRPFDGSGGELAHSWYRGDIHIDDDTFFRSSAAENTPDSISLLKVVTHEIGHVLGLTHTIDRSSVMFPLDSSFRPSAAFELNAADRFQVQGIHGRCSAPINAIVDLIQPMGPVTVGQNIRLVYNTFIFRGGSEWLYHNGQRRPRYGDPRPIVDQWSGFPTVNPSFDAVVQILPRALSSQNQFHSKVMLFSGNDYFEFDLGKDRMKKGFPIPISNAFRMANSSTPLPNRVDTGFFNPYDSRLYLIKSDLVYVLYEDEPESMTTEHPLAADNDTHISTAIKTPSGFACCERISTVADEFPRTAAKSITSSEQPSINSPIDAIYNSYFSRRLFLFSGPHVWYNSGIVGGSEPFLFAGHWSRLWRYICDV